jgi:predicted transcriptional regulator
MITMACVIKIVDSMEAYNAELKSRLKEGEMTKPERGIIMTPETFSKVFSPERIKLLRKICQNNISSIYQLARELDKPYEVVFRNIKYLEGLGLLKIRRKANRKIPSLVAGISISMFADVAV